MIYYSLGELVDRLAIVNLKQWHLEEKISDPNISLEDKGEFTKQVESLNDFRMKLIASIDEYYEKATDSQ
jgi:hypothetical protein